VGVVSYYVRGSGYEPKSQEHERRLDLSREVVESLMDFLDNRGVDSVLNHQTAEVVGSRGVSLDEMENEADVVITVGGDGTVLRTVSSMEEPVPLLGINTGTVGFLAACKPGNALDEVTDILEGFDVEHRARLSVEVNGNPIPPALNETVIVTGRPAKIMAFDVYHGGDIVESIRSDGIVVATPTGSTAYSMSAGGPLVDPDVSARLLVPLAPYRIQVAPWVLGCEKVTKVVPTRVKETASVVVDGDEVIEVSRGDEITFTQAESDALFVRTGDNFFDRVRKKLE